jgi:hypothetical protein
VTDQTPQEGELILYRTADDVVRVDVPYESDTFWLDQRRMSELFGVDVHTGVAPRTRRARPASRCHRPETGHRYTVRATRARRPARATRGDTRRSRSSRPTRPMAHRARGRGGGRRAGDRRACRGAGHGRSGAVMRRRAAGAQAEEGTVVRSRVLKCARQRRVTHGVPHG